MSRKPNEVGDAQTRVNHEKSRVDTGKTEIVGYPHCGEGCGDTLTTRFALEKRFEDGQLESARLDFQNFGRCATVTRWKKERAMNPVKDGMKS